MVTDMFAQGTFAGQSENVGKDIHEEVGQSGSVQVTICSDPCPLSKAHLDTDGSNWDEEHQGASYFPKT